ncbi:phage terminase large subunit-like protein [Salana multivorans]|uniref:Phage terminase large subunit-like protein n=1 Tax=Salana multivorans TaxID=120377 RepID=A0A3N2D6V7_9MICO|nr:terminase [Salana multivorans]ROR95507.1 phage terminase large subunit-like protein [Salana multivorans]
MFVIAEADNLPDYVDPETGDIYPEILEPNYLGPSWKKNPDGSWHLPEFTLGWQIAGWCAKYLKGKGGKPWNFSDEQLRFVLWWYAVDEYGNWLYNRGVLQRLKGWGKDPLLAVISIVEWVGPSRVVGWAEHGPVGGPADDPWVLLTATSISQTRNTTLLIPNLMTDLFRKTYQIPRKLGKEILYATLPNGTQAILEPLTSNPRPFEGKRPTFVLENETQHWVKSNSGHEMHQQVDDNITKVDGARYLAITNAPEAGEDSIAEQVRRAWELVEEQVAKGARAWNDTLYDSVEANERAPLDPRFLRRILERLRGDSIWLNIDNIIASIVNPMNPPSNSRRKWLNQILADDDALISPQMWDVLRRPDDMLQAGEAIALGFDGGKSDDATALVAIRLSDGFIQPIEVWEKPDGPKGDGWKINRELVESAVHECFRVYNVKAFFADVALWESNIAEWGRLYGHKLAVKARGAEPIGWDMRESLKALTHAHERFLSAITERKVTHDGDPILRRHAMNARRRENNFGVSFGKESRESQRKVDAYAAAMLAHEAFHQYHQRGREERKRTGRGVFI